MKVLQLATLPACAAILIFIASPARAESSLLGTAWNGCGQAVLVGGAVTGVSYLAKKPLPVDKVLVASCGFGAVGAMSVAHASEAPKEDQLNEDAALDSPEGE